MASELTPAPIDPDLNYRIKKIGFGDKTLSICTQNQNGPCPLLAMTNALVIRGDVYIHPDKSFVSFDELVSLITDYIARRASTLTLSKEEKLNYEANMEAALSTLPALAKGLDVNVKFNHVNDFEFTAECAVFDLVGVPLRHGWILEPSTDIKTLSLISKKSYNQLMEILVNESVATDRLESLSKAMEAEIAKPELASSSTSNNNDLPPPYSSLNFMQLNQNPSSSSSTSATVQNFNTENVPNSITSVCPSTSTISESEMSKLLEDIEQGTIVKQWLGSTASQLTFQGVLKLHESVKENQVCVFFRNNHFATLLKKNQELWILVTDQGYSKQAGIVWEKLDCVSGDTQFATSTWKLFTGSPSDYNSLAESDSSFSEASFTVTATNQEGSISLDEQLARQLQAAEDRKAAKLNQSQQGEKQKSPRNNNGATNDAHNNNGHGKDSERLKRSAPASSHHGEQNNNSTPNKNSNGGKLTQSTPAKPKQAQQKEDDGCVIC